MDFTPPLYNQDFLPDGEQKELGLLPFQDPEPPVPPGSIRLGRRVRIGRNVRLKPPGT